MTDPTPAPMSLQIVVTGADPASHSHTVSVADRAEAHRVLGYYRDEAGASFTGFLTDAEGRYAGTGIAGSGRHMSDWA